MCDEWLRDLTREGVEPNPGPCSVNGCVCTLTLEIGAQLNQFDTTTGRCKTDGCGHSAGQHSTAAVAPQPASTSYPAKRHAPESTSLAVPFPKIDRAKQRLEQMQQASVSVTELSSPRTLLSLPFPESLVLHSPRFGDLQASTFSFMGREAFLTLYNKWEYAFNTHLPATIHLLGTSGYGKSHILAALAVYITAKSAGTARVVYIGDCGHLFENPLLNMKAALSQAFADDDDALEIIADSNSTEALSGFCSRCKRMTFIADQYNALDVVDKDPNGSLKTLTSQLIRNCAGHHVLICGASLNNASSQRYRRKSDQRSYLLVDLSGGFTETEFDGWLSLYSQKISKFDDSELQHLRDYSGDVPIYLFRFLKIIECHPDQNFDFWWQEFISCDLVTTLQRNLSESCSQLRNLKDNNPAGYGNALSFLLSCCLGQPNPPIVADSLYDCRYFYVDDRPRIGRCLNAFVRNYFVYWLRENKLMDEWLPSNRLSSSLSSTRNPSIRGFIVEQLCIGGILTRDVAYLPAQPAFRPSALEYFAAGSEPSVDSNSAFCTLYVPTAFNYHAVDGIIRVLLKHRDAPNWAKALIKTGIAVIIIGVQITLQSVQDHARSAADFFLYRGNWAKDDADVKWVFQWIVPQEKIGVGVPRLRDVQQRPQRGRSGKTVVLPNFTELIDSIEAITGMPGVLDQR